MVLGVSSNIANTEVNATYQTTITGLPGGLHGEMINIAMLCINGYTDQEGTYTVNLTVTRGSYSDTKQYTIHVTDDGYGFELVSIDLPNSTRNYYSYYRKSTAYNDVPINVSITVHNECA